MDCPFESVEVLGKTFNIEGVTVDGDLENDGGVAAGFNHVLYQTIKYRDDQSLHQLKDTLLHELIHIIDYGCAVGLEERQVHALATGLLATLWENPKFSQWLVNRNQVGVKNEPSMTLMTVPVPRKRKQPAPVEQAPEPVKHPMGFVTGKSVAVDTPQ